MPETNDKTGFREIGVSGLDFTAGMVRADPKVELHGRKGSEQYDLMRHEDPTVAATLLALSLPVRQASWRVNPASDAPADIEAAEFVESCMNDMSVSWDDVLTEACTMYPFGWAFMEWVLKKRQGLDQKGPNVAQSKYVDGRIGFRKIALRSQTSLLEWEMQDDGGIVAMVQENTGAGKPYRIPLAKALLFRTTRESNNPEGMSVLRPGYRAWKYKYQMERIEAIGLQRALTGVPVVKFTQGYTSIADAGSQSDEARAQALIKGLYNNTLLGVIEDQAMEFRFEVPKMQGITGDSTRVIQRYDEGIARSTLAMYILLGSRERGSYALSRELGDLFFLAVDGFISMIAQVFTQWAIPVLMERNTFPGITEYPEITTAINRRVDLETLANFINKTVGAQVITPDPELEKYVRELADFPPLAVTVGVEEGLEEEEEDEESGEPRAEEEEEEPAPAGTKPTQARMKTRGRKVITPASGAVTEGGGVPERASRRRGERFARSRGKGKLAGYGAATDDYEGVMRQEYMDWVDDLIHEFDDVPTMDMAAAQSRWKEAVAALLLLLKKKSWAYLPAAMALGFGDPGLPPQWREALTAEMAQNDDWLESNLGAAILAELGQEEIEQIMLLLATDQVEEASQFIEDQLRARRSHVGKYAGHYWRLIWIGALAALEDSGYVGPIRWVVDELAKHCNTCLQFGQREYASIADLKQATNGVLPGLGTECNGSCRCHLEKKTEKGWEPI